MSERPGLAKSSVVVAAGLVLLGLVITLLSLAPWVRTSNVGSRGENLTGVALSNSGWWVFATGAQIATTGAVMFATRRAIVAGAAVPGAALVAMRVSEVAAGLAICAGVAMIAMWLLRLSRRRSLAPLRSASA